MPELPEVETVVRSLRGQLVGRQILDISNSWRRHIAFPDYEQLRERIRNKTITGLSRRGKYLVFSLDSGDFLIIHLKMTGQLKIVPEGTEMSDYTHTVFLLSGEEELRFHDVRKFGKVYLTDDESLVLGKLGPEPLSPAFTRKRLFEMLKDRHRILKPLLIDQGFIAGIGNIYADESLHRARIDPRRISNSLNEQESRLLHDGIRRTLREAIENGGATISDYRRPDGTEGEMQHSFRVYGREEEPCYRCKGKIKRIILGGRSTYFCPSCQM